MFFSIKRQGETRSEKRAKERANKEKMDAEMAEYKEELAREAAQESAKLSGVLSAGGSRPGSSARNQILTPGMGGGAMRASSGGRTPIGSVGRAMLGGAATPADRPEAGAGTPLGTP